MMSKVWSVSSVHNGGQYRAELVKWHTSGSLVKVFGWYPFPVTIMFYSSTASIIDGGGVSLRSGAMLLEVT